MEVEGVSPYSSEPIPQARGLGGCQPPTLQDGQAGESAGDSAQLPEKRKSDEKEDKKVYVRADGPEIGESILNTGGNLWKPKNRKKIKAVFMVL